MRACSVWSGGGPPIQPTVVHEEATARAGQHIRELRFTVQMSASSSATSERVPEQIEAEDFEEGTVVLLVKWKGVDEPSWVPQADTERAEFSDVVTEWESAKAAGLATDQDNSSDSAESRSDSSDENGEGPSEIEQLGMQAAVRAAESGAGCAAAASAAAAAVRAGGGSKEEQTSAASSAAAFVAVVQGLAPREAAAAAADAFDAAEGTFATSGETTAAPEGPAAAAAAPRSTNAGGPKRSRSDRDTDDDETATSASVAAAPVGASAKKLARVSDEMGAEEEAVWVRTFEARFRSALR